MMFLQNAVQKYSFFIMWGSRGFLIPGYLTNFI